MFLFFSFFLFFSPPHLSLVSIFTFLFSFVLWHFRLHFTFFLFFSSSTPLELSSLFFFLFSFLLFSSSTLEHSRSYLFLFFFLFFSFTQVFSPSSFIFFFTSRTFQQPHICFTLEKRERERERGERLGQIVCRPTAGGDRGCRKDEVGGDWRSPCSTITFAAPPLLVLLPTTKLGQIGLFFFYFSYLLVLIQLYFMNWILLLLLWFD